MCWGAMMTAAALCCPPSGPVVYYHGPQNCCFTGVPAPVAYREVPCVVQTAPAPLTALAPVPSEPLTTTQAVAQDKLADPVLEAASAEEDDSVLEDAAFGLPGAFGPRPSLDQLGLGWGVASIGNGVLSPNAGITGGGGGFGGGWGGGSGGSNPGSGVSSGSSSQGPISIVNNNWNNLPPIIITIPPPLPPIMRPPGPPGPNPNPVPEPATLALWALGVAGVALRKRFMG